MPDFLDQLGLLGVTARLKRASDALSEDIKTYYASVGVDLEPSWHLVLLYLRGEEGATMTELAESLQLSAPATTKMVRRMSARGYVDVTEDPDDRRKKRLRLSARARARFAEFERIWGGGRSAVEELLGREATALLRALSRLEARQRAEGFAERAQRHLEEETSR